MGRRGADSTPGDGAGTEWKPRKAGAICEACSVVHEKEKEEAEVIGANAAACQRAMMIALLDPYLHNIVHAWNEMK